MGEAPVTVRTFGVARQSTLANAKTNGSGDAAASTFLAEKLS